MSKTTWYVIGGVVLVAGIVGIVLYMAGQQAQAAAPVLSSDLPQGSGGNAAGIFSTIWAGVGQITGGAIAAATSNDASTGTESA